MRTRTKLELSHVGGLARDIIPVQTNSEKSVVSVPKLLFFAMSGSGGEERVDKCQHSTNENKIVNCPYPSPKLS